MADDRAPRESPAPEDPRLEVAAFLERLESLPAEGRELELESRCADARVRTGVENILETSAGAALDRLLATRGALGGSLFDELARELSASRSLAPGALVGGFEVRGLLGKGGLGEVYLAWDPTLQREVAIKTVSRRATPDLVERLRREARALAALNHPQVVTVHGLVEQGGSCYLVMERVEGETLAERLRRGPLSWRELRGLSVDLAAAVEVAHRRGIVHRDLKPGNLMITPDRRLKVLDFGIARERAGAERTSPPITRAGTLVGTVAYMAPEQLRGETGDVHSDLFALGVVLYEAATGRRPFGGASEADVIAAILHQTPAPIGELAPALPAGLDAVVARCLEKDPERRHPSAAALGAALAALEAPSGAPSSVAVVSTEALARGESETREVGSSSSAAYPAEQELRFCTTSDGEPIAWAEAGTGEPAIVRVLGWFTHLELEWRSELARRFWRRLARRHRLVRYDGRGIGISATGAEPRSRHFDIETRLRDLDAVVAAAGLERFALLGMSEGCAAAIAYAARHPERVSHLVLYGGFARAPDEPEHVEQWRILQGMVRDGWGQQTPIFGELFARLFLGNQAAEERLRYFDEMQRASADPVTAYRQLASVGQLDVRVEAARVAAPTLVLHRSGDRVIPIEHGRRLAQSIPGARFVVLDAGDNHWLYFDEDGAARHLIETIERFLDEPSPSGSVQRGP
jgi:serine/threonine protein kinase/alpha-beta hydrolase superfamily lysophospholipase